MKRTRLSNASRGMAPKAKMVKKENINHEDNHRISEGNGMYQNPALKPSVEIVSCISYQKFRYSGENRPGKKYQEKDFMTLKLNNLSDKVVRVVIICTDADNRELIHPNGLVGKDCHHGIYDKEYAVTKPTFSIKIPYLRTERIKTKKNEHQKIQQVLSERASHLPSPYKERCLSQCTDKYTSSRKFDTTKVCLGVIVTVQSHQGPFNGSLHAISHVVRNASEKTSLGILKLSQDFICAYSGSVIDIFTTEEGPTIEPEKYVVYVSANLDSERRWESEKFSPGKSDIMYKRIITYRMPQFDPQPDVAQPVDAFLHLECPQSNQYCQFPFQYGPNPGIVIEQDQSYNGDKYFTEDIKPKIRLPQQMYDSDVNSEAIKANLKSKLTSRQEQVFIEAPGESHGSSNQFILQEPQQNFSGQHSVYIQHQDPQTGESSFLLDMDASKSLTNGDSTHQYIQQYSEIKRGKQSSFANTSDVQVVATGFSDAVPPNTTVLIYTTNGGFTEHVISGAPGEQVIIQELSDEEAAASSSIIVNDDVTEERSQPSTLISNGQSEQVVRREAIAEKKMTNSKAQTGNSTLPERSERALTQSASDHVMQSPERQIVVRGSYSSGDVHADNPGKPQADRSSPVPVSFPSTIPPLRRMLISIPHSTSAWEVGTEEDQSESFNLINYGYEKKQSLEKQSDPEAVKSSTYHNQYASQKPLHVIEGSDGVLYKISKDLEGSNKQDNCQKLTSMDFNMQQAIVENLPTMKVIELAEIIESGLPSTTSVVETTDT